MAKEPVRIAAVAAAAGFLLQAAFQAALALGAPLGSASWGGAYEGQLPMGLRIASGVAVGVYVLFALIVLGRGGFGACRCRTASSDGGHGCWSA